MPRRCAVSCEVLMSTDRQADRQQSTLPWEIERRRFVTVDEAARLKSVSRDTFQRYYAHLIQDLSPRRRGVRLGDLLGDNEYFTRSR